MAYKLKNILYQNILLIDSWKSNELTNIYSDKTIGFIRISIIRYTYIDSNLKNILYQNISLIDSWKSNELTNIYSDKTIGFIRISIIRYIDSN